MNKQYQKYTCFFPYCLLSKPMGCKDTCSEVILEINAINGSNEI